MGNFQQKQKVNKYGRSFSNNEEQRYRTDEQILYDGNHIMTKSTIKIRSSHSPDKSNYMNSSSKQSKILPSEFNSFSSRTENRFPRKDDIQQSTHKMFRSQREKGISQMDKSFRQLKDEEIRENKLKKRLQKQQKFSGLIDLDKIENLKESIDFVTCYFEMQQVDTIPMNHLATMSSLEGENSAQQFEYKLINYPKHEYRTDIKMANQMSLFQSLSQNNEQYPKSKQKSNLQILKNSQQSSVIGKYGMNNSQIINQQISQIESIGQKIKEKHEQQQPFKKSEVKFQENNNDQFLQISKQLNNKVQPELKMKENRFARPVSSHIYHGMVSESQLKQQQQQYNPLGNDDERHLIYTQNPFLFSSHISKDRSMDQVIQDNFSNISLDQQNRDQSPNQNKSDFIKIQQQFGQSSAFSPSPQRDEKKSLYETLSQRKMQQNILQLQDNLKNSDIHEHKIFQQQQKMNRMAAHGENTFGFQRQRSQSEAQLPNHYNFKQATDLFDKSLANTQAFKEYIHNHQIQAKQMESNQNFIPLNNQNQSTSTNGEDNKKLQLSLGTKQTDSTPKFLINQSSNVALSGKFLLQSQSTISNEKLHNNSGMTEQQSSKNAINQQYNQNGVILSQLERINQYPQQLNNSSQSREPYLTNIPHDNYSNNQILTNSQNMMMQQRNVQDSFTQTTRFKPNLNYTNHLKQMREIRSVSPSFKSYFEPSLIGPNQSQTYSDIIKKMQHLYTQQSKFLYDSIINKKYSEYQPQIKQQKNIEKNNKTTNVKKQNGILQITSKPKQILGASYADIHAKKHQKQQYDLIDNKSYLEQKSPYNSTNNLSQRHSHINLSRNNQNQRSFHINSSPNNLSQRQSHINLSTNYLTKQNTSSPNQIHLKQKAENNDKYSPVKMNQNSSKRKNSNDYKNSSQISKQSNKDHKSANKSKEFHTNQSPRYFKNLNENNKYQKHYYLDEQEYDEEDYEDYNSQKLHSSSNSTSDIQPPIKISLKVSQFKKKNPINNNVDNQNPLSQNTPLDTYTFSPSQYQEDFQEYESNSNNIISHQEQQQNQTSQLLKQQQSQLKQQQIQKSKYRDQSDKEEGEADQQFVERYINTPNYFNQNQDNSSKKSLKSSENKQKNIKHTKIQNRL